MASFQEKRIFFFFFHIGFFVPRLLYIICIGDVEEKTLAGGDKASLWKTRRGVGSDRKNSVAKHKFSQRHHNHHGLGVRCHTSGNDLSHGYNTGPYNS